MTRNLDLALIGNGAHRRCSSMPIGAVVWGCFPRFDGDPAFCALLDDAAPGDERGIYGDRARRLRARGAGVRRRTPRCSSRASSTTRGGVDRDHRLRAALPAARPHVPADDASCGTMRRVAGSPRIVVRLRPAVDYGRAQPDDHRRQRPHPLRRCPDMTLRLTTDASLTAILEERPFFLERRRHAAARRRTKPLPSAVDEVGRRFVEETIDVLARLGAPARDPVRMAGAR